MAETISLKKYEQACTAGIKLQKKIASLEAQIKDLNNSQRQKRIAELEAQLAEAKNEIKELLATPFAGDPPKQPQSALPPHRNVICEDCEKEGDTSIDGHANFYCGSCMAKECMKIEQALPPQSRELKDEYIRKWITEATRGRGMCDLYKLARYAFDYGQAHQPQPKKGDNDG
jgi:hypothetical protein